jgi:hypothetical protein
MFPNARFGKEVCSLPYADWKQRKELISLDIEKDVRNDAVNALSKKPIDQLKGDDSDGQRKI